MCGIMGYVGTEQATPILIDGLRRLEYRGYDSAGIAVLSSGEIKIVRAEGKLSNLERMVNECNLVGNTGIGHTRWATHGNPNEMNAHPHRSGDIVVVHNGIIENYLELRESLTASGHRFTSETDTEVICHLMDYNFKRNGGDSLSALRETLARLRGSYAMVIMNAQEPGVLYIAKTGSPMVLGESNGSRYVASDIPALLPYTKGVIFIEDGEHAVVSSREIKIYDSEGTRINREKQHIPWNPVMAEKGGFKHFMLKEIHDQRDMFQDIFAGRVSKERGVVELKEIDSLFDGSNPKFDRIAIVACGTSLHAAMVGRYIIESLTKIPVAIDYASEFRYRDPILDSRTLIVPISQSGETADTIAAEKLAKERGCTVMAICNVLGSSITRMADTTIYTYAGPEIGVASTKAFTAQLVALVLFALDVSRRTGSLGGAQIRSMVEEMLKLPRLVAEVLEQSNHIKDIAEMIAGAENVLFIGRNHNFPVALEGALKLKEISYVHSEGFAAGELKHGPIALIDSGVPVVAIIPKDESYEKMLSNIEEVKARGAFTIAVASEGDEAINFTVNEVVRIPAADEFMTPILASIPLQLIAYFAADHKGTDVDQPRNLAKSVTVE
ncbi:MAG TPA: glutamine--fructose-6-phosphate transaminase (isomerizing) [bacterium]|nr:glutamine--fructose-6-phosphate transaminase (isomerizing) [Myxococcales bacterium]OQA61657.1 MAG: Glutamine--fructose-6-phosphate aminotransferase (isomerizing) [bacterium ADurb.Bin270]HPW45493.1 glutamine--fructose-6-phosphate transaminase (isomerizing) [bacterium]HQC50750.1 glutamine--fructose-6-phosphate transaminase (isomerizing) [bacterium]HQG13334.1 glutamine--fructose-6-phosphate transaminase (isomerizing) [bacterium]